LASPAEWLMFNSTPDVCVAGGGPAGLAAAIALKRIGCAVVVVDCAVPPIDKACGEGLMPHSLLELRELGIEIPDGAGFPFRGIRFADRHSSVCSGFPNGLGKGVRRTILHELLIQRATDLAIPMIWNAKHIDLVEGGISLGNRLLNAGLVVGADGQNSRIRRQSGLDEVTREKRRYGFRRHYRVAPWSSYMEVHWGARSQIYVTPVAPDEVCVAVISGDSKLRLREGLCDFPGVQRQLKSAEPVSTEMGALSVSRTLKSVSRKNVALIGDASGSVDAITGEGICVSIKQAHALAIAVKNGDMHEYQQFHRKLMKRPRQMAFLMLMLERSGHLQRRALAGLARNPALFTSLLAIHVGAGRLGDLWSRELLGFGRAFLAA
jgi:menaquinone-9 beta-reductase